MALYCLSFFLKVVFLSLMLDSPERSKWDALGSRVVQLLELSTQIKTTPPFQFIEVSCYSFLNILFIRKSLFIS